MITSEQPSFLFCERKDLAESPQNALRAFLRVRRQFTRPCPETKHRRSGGGDGWHFERSGSSQARLPSFGTMLPKNFLKNFWQIT